MRNDSCNYAVIRLCAHLITQEDISLCISDAVMDKPSCAALYEANIKPDHVKTQYMAGLDLGKVHECSKFVTVSVWVLFVSLSIECCIWPIA